MDMKATSKVSECRQEISELFNIENPLNIIFTANATQALNIAIRGVLKRRDQVITTVMEHNSVLRPLSNLGKRGIEVTFLGVDRYGVLNLDNLKKELRRNTKAIIINHVSNVIGTIQDIKAIGEIAKNEKVLFIVDASQSVGHLEIDVEESNIDLMAFSGHKGLMGPQGTGGLYIRPGVKVESFIHGETFSNSNSIEQPDFQKYSTVLSINMEGFDSAQVGYLLNKKDIAVRTGFHCASLIHGVLETSHTGTVRISLGYFNSEEDIEKLTNAIINIHNRM